MGKQASAWEQWEQYAARTLHRLCHRLFRAHPDSRTERLTDCCQLDRLWHALWPVDRCRDLVCHRAAACTDSAGTDRDTWRPRGLVRVDPLDRCRLPAVSWRTAMDGGTGRSHSHETPAAFIPGDRVARFRDLVHQSEDAAVLRRVLSAILGPECADRAPGCTAVTDLLLYCRRAGCLRGAAGWPTARLPCDARQAAQPPVRRIPYRRRDRTGVGTPRVVLVRRSTKRGS